ncbi:hypothetical protein ES708_33516 [subsurface metagenome]
MVFRFSGYRASSMVNTLTLCLCIKFISCSGMILFFSSKSLEDILLLKFSTLDISPDFACQAASTEPKYSSSL